MGKLLRFRGPRSGQAEDEAWMFDGLEGLAVVIEDLDPVAVEAGLNRTNLQLHIEKRLGEAGMPVAPLVGAAGGDAVAVLYITIGTEQGPAGPVAFFLSLQVCEEASLARDPAHSGGVTTWLTNGVWVSSLGDLQRDAMAAIDEGLERLGTSFLVGREA